MLIFYIGKMIWLILILLTIIAILKMLGILDEKTANKMQFGLLKQLITAIRARLHIKDDKSKNKKGGKKKSLFKEIMDIIFGNRDDDDKDDKDNKDEKSKKK